MKATNLFVGVSVVALGAIVLGGALGTTTACNSGNGACPTTPIVPDDTCTDEYLQCEYDLATPSAACDGTTTTIPSSCTCTKGHWACPDPFACDGGEEAGDGGDDSSDEAGEAGDDGGDASDASDASDGGD